MRPPPRYQLQLYRRVPSLKSAVRLKLSSPLTFDPWVFLEGVVGLSKTKLAELAGLREEFKIAERAEAGQSKPSRTTLRTLVRKISVLVNRSPEAWLEDCLSSRPWGAFQRGASLQVDDPRAPFINTMVQAESASEVVITTALRSCSKFWGSEEVGRYGAPIDTSIIAARNAQVPLVRVEPFLREGERPFAHLISELGQMLGSGDMTSTTRALGKYGVALSDGLLRKWACGEQMPRRSQVEDIWNALPLKFRSRFGDSYCIARGLTFFIGVLSAASAEAPAYVDLQARLLRRWQELYSSESSPW